jgi:hypothetical protein
MISSDFDVTLTTVYNNLRGVIELEFSTLLKTKDPHEGEGAGEHD